MRNTRRRSKKRRRKRRRRRKARRRSPSPSPAPVERNPDQPSQPLLNPDQPSQPLLNPDQPNRWPCQRRNPQALKVPPGLRWENRQARNRQGARELLVLEKHPRKGRSNPMDRAGRRRVPLEQRSLQAG
ncbi:hypothetical protein BD779DRAFT_1524265 [Infundibulicybe gibba]|nr:hypothetical protein BD779DRAFT_1524265 [Infundibulicybe gibba]